LAGNEAAVAGQRLSPSGECSHRYTTTTSDRLRVNLLRMPEPVPA
jgi:hypothetical protein